MAVSRRPPPGSCYVPWPAETSRGIASTLFKWMSPWLPPDTRIETSPICASACWSVPRCAGADSFHAGGSDRSAIRSRTLRRYASRDCRLSAGYRPRSPGTRADGHTASLVPGDPVLDVTESDVALTGVYQGKRRMTLTYPIINRSRRILWLVNGSEKVGMLGRLLAGDPSIPAGRVWRDHALVVADRAAAGTPLPAAARPGELGVSVALGKTWGSKGIVR